MTRTRRHGGGASAPADGLAFLQANLSTPSGLKFYFTYLTGVTKDAGTGAVSQINSLVGVVPPLTQGVTAKQPIWTVNEGIQTVDSTGFMETANDAVYDGSLIKTLVHAGLMSTRKNLISVGQNGTNNVIVVGAGNTKSQTNINGTIIASTVDGAGGGHRTIVSIVNGTTGSVSVINETPVTATVTPPTTFSGTVKVAVSPTGSGFFTAGFGLNYVATAGDLAIIKTWGETFYGSISV